MDKSNMQINIQISNNMQIVRKSLFILVIKYVSVEHDVVFLLLVDFPVNLYIMKCG